MTDLHLRVPVSLIDDVDELAKREGLPRPEYIRRKLSQVVVGEKEQATLETVLARLDTLSGEVERLREKVEGR